MGVVGVSQAFVAPSNAPVATAKKRRSDDIRNKKRRDIK
jgi:hypothetical protein